MIPGRSRIWISAPPYSRTPGIAVSVVKEYAATSDFVFVIFESRVDFPTEGKPTSAIRASIYIHTLHSAPLFPAPVGSCRGRGTSALGHIEACSGAGAGARSWLEQLCAEPGEFSFQQTEMVFGGFVFSGRWLVSVVLPSLFFLSFFLNSFFFFFFREMVDGGRGLLGPPHLLLDFFDLLADTHGGILCSSSVYM